MSRSEGWQWQGQDCPWVCLTCSSPLETALQIDIPGQALRPRDKARTSAINLISEACVNKLIAYGCLEAFEIWGQDWVVDARKLLDALHDVGVVRHLQSKGDIAPWRVGRELSPRKSVYHKISILQNLWRMSLSADLSLSSAFTTCLTADGPEGPLVWAIAPISLCG